MLAAERCAGRGSARGGSACGAPAGELARAGVSPRRSGFPGAYPQATMQQRLPATLYPELQQQRFPPLSLTCSFVLPCVVSSFMLSGFVKCSGTLTYI